MCGLTSLSNDIDDAYAALRAPLATPRSSQLLHTYLYHIVGNLYYAHLLNGHLY